MVIVLLPVNVYALDVTLQVMAHPSNHTVPAEQEDRRYRRGDIVRVYPRLNQTSPISNKTRSVYIHITGVPSTAIQKAKRLMQVQRSGSTVNDVIVRRRQFRIDPQTLPQVVRDTLLADGEIEVTWVQAKPYLIDMVTGLAVEDGDVN